MTGYRRNFIPGGSFFFTVSLVERRLPPYGEDWNLSRGLGGDISIDSGILANGRTRGKVMGFAGAQPILRAGAAANRQASTGALDKVAGKQLDEYPSAMFREGGAGASVRPINPRDNMSAGACIGNACRGLPDGTRIQIKIGD